MIAGLVKNFPALAAVDAQILYQDMRCAWIQYLAVRAGRFMTANV